MLVDFHCHTNCSDGELSVAELITLAEQGNLEMLAITDHDNIDAYQKLPNTNIKIISGVEFSTTWNKIGVHIIGLDFDLKSKEFLQIVELQQHARKHRAKTISQRLEKYGLNNAYAKLAHKKHIGRPDFANLLVATGICKDQQHAFKKYLGAGKTGDVKSQWQNLEQIIKVINNAGGISVLAHPLYYKLTNAKLRRLITAFKLYGGGAIEVINGYQNPDKTEYLSKLSYDFDLKASIGSDFHNKSGWKKLGIETSLVTNLLIF